MISPLVRCVGVWDTVGSVLNESNTLHLDDTFLPETVDVALHALSIHENRARFLPTLWTIPASGLAKKADGATQVIKQVRRVFSMFFLLQMSTLRGMRRSGSLGLTRMLAADTRSASSLIFHCSGWRYVQVCIPPFLPRL